MALITSDCDVLGLWFFIIVVFTLSFQALLARPLLVCCSSAARLVVWSSGLWPPTNRKPLTLALWLCCRTHTQGQRSPEGRTAPSPGGPRLTAAIPVENSRLQL